MADFAPLPSPLPRASFLVFARELFALLDAPFTPGEADGEQFSEYTQGTLPSHSSREGSRWKDGVRTVEVCLHEEHASSVDGTRSRLEASISGLPGDCKVELKSGDGDAGALVNARVEGSAEDARRIRVAMTAAIAAALVLAPHARSGGTRGAS